MASLKQNNGQDGYWSEETYSLTVTIKKTVNRKYEQNLRFYKWVMAK